MNMQGKMVTVLGIASNGTEEQAAVITRDWGPHGNIHHVNLTVFPDCATPFTRGSVNFYIDEQEARKAYAEAEPNKMPVCWLKD